MAFIESLGRQTISIFHQLGAIILLLIATVKEIGTIRSRETFKQCLSLGVLSFPIVALTLLFTGMVLSVQIAGELTKYGADFTVGAIVAIGIGRELGPVLCGVVLAGRVGAAITAEIGTMRVTEQIDALRCMAVSPIGYLVVPRLVACMAMLPILNVFGVVIGVGGGMIVASLSHGVSSYVFMHSIRVFCVPSDLYIGVIKSIIFGMIVALVGCDRGMTCTAGAEGVGKATTQSVVYSIIMLFAANYILSSILF
ncbi:MlaE family ABC transporter permease [Dialister hominis]|jgi:phospholipid/cholesterol/gamma-HCH transport system permease protein|uniref:MlaE family ABC transporter permease n=1 Tax=Dialister hominis TaxID=2582419 RepID=UPI00266FBDDF|nr:ABC transporter permease [uncultured Dialister sp.]MEE1350061.1 ABC transporter permease [Dialister hominis]